MINRVFGILLALGFLCPVHSQNKTISSRPNIIYILADDLGYGDVLAYNKYSKIPTPNIDRLASSGMKFNNAHSASAVCTPSRYSILTGNYPWRSGLKKGVLWAYDWPLIKKDQLTVGQFLKNNGYHTAIIGKWHLGWSWPVKKGEFIDSTRWGAMNETNERERKIDFTQPLKGGPLSCGFDYQFGVDIPSLPPFCFIENGNIIGGNLMQQKPQDIVGAKGMMESGWTSEKMLPTIINKADEYIRNQVKTNNQQPFFLFLSLSAPHVPIAPNQSYKGKSKAGDYGDFVFEMDDYIGRILNTLDELNITKNTLVIFTSDNGGTMQAGDLTTRGVEASTFGSLYKLYNHNSSGKWKGMKGDIWEGGHRVPFIASWPSVIPAGKTNNNKISLTDFFATCSGILNIALPQSAAIDSYNMFETFKGKNQNKPTRENILYSSSKGCISIHKGRWKYIDCNDSGGSLVNQHIKNDYVYETAGQLYDMEKDETETTNLYNKYPLIVKELKQLVEIYKASGQPN